MENLVLPLLFRDDPAFLADLPYDPEVLFLDALLELDRDKGLIKCRMPTPEDLPLTRSQRVHPTLHPRHVAGAIMVHATAMLGFVHAYHVLGLRHRDGWIGYGTNIHKVAFRKLVPPGTPIEATCVSTRSRIGTRRHLIRYRFEYRHEGTICYEGEQTAMWLLVDANGPPPSPLGGADEG